MDFKALVYQVIDDAEQLSEGGMDLESACHQAWGSLLVALVQIRRLDEDEQLVWSTMIEIQRRSTTVKSLGKGLISQELALKGKSIPDTTLWRILTSLHDKKLARRPNGKTWSAVNIQEILGSQSSTHKAVR